MIMQELEQVSQKRSKGVLIFAIVFIMFGVFSSISLIKYPTPVSINKLIFVLQTLCYLVTGIFILQLKDFARKLAIYLAIFSMAGSIILLPKQLQYLKTVEPIYQEQIENSFAEKRKHITETTSPKNLDAALNKLDTEHDASYKLMPKLMSFMVFFSVFMAIVFNSLVIFFFLRPKVKSQFETKGTAHES